MKYQSGDRVRMIESYPPGVKTGDCGTFIMYDEYNRPVIRWDDYGSWKHDADGMVEMGHGWFVGEKQFELISAVDLGALPETESFDITKFLFDT